MNGIPFEALPFPALRHFRYELAPDVQALVTGADGCPVVAVKQYGRGRVVGLAYYADNIWPALKAKRWETNENFWEYLCSLLMRSLIWASGKEPTVQLREVVPSPACVSADQAAQEQVTLRLSNAGKAAAASLSVVVRDDVRREERTITKQVKLPSGESEVVLDLASTSPAGGRHFVDVIVCTDGKKSDWGAGLYEVRKEARLAKVTLDQEGVARGRNTHGKGEGERRRPWDGPDGGVAGPDRTPARHPREGGARGADPLLAEVPRRAGEYGDRRLHAPLRRPHRGSHPAQNGLGLGSAETVDGL